MVAAAAPASTHEGSATGQSKLAAKPAVTTPQVLRRQLERLVVDVVKAAAERDAPPEVPQAREDLQEDVDSEREVRRGHGRRGPCWLLTRA
jgi:hypothetical protein